MTATILVTGAAGLIGAEVAARLTARGHAVIGLVHHNTTVVRNDGRELRAADWAGRAEPGALHRLRGDVREPSLGLDENLLRQIQSTVDLVVHTAAITDFGRARSVYEEVNVRGTGNLLTALRPVGGQPIPLVHVSTAYVCGERVGTVLENELDEGQSFGTAYEESKFRAEKEVRKSGVPFAVVRPSIVVGSERNGLIREFQNMYVVLKALAEGRVRAIPGHYDARLDLVPVEHVADVVATAATRFAEAEGKTFHAIGHAPCTLRDFSDVMAEYPSFRVPRYIPPSSFDVTGLPAAERVYYERIVGLYESFFLRRMRFEDENTLALLGRRPALPGKRFLRRLFDHCLKVGYLGNPLPSVDEVLAGLGPDR